MFQVSAYDTNAGIEKQIAFFRRCEGVVFSECMYSYDTLQQLSITQLLHMRHLHVRTVQSRQTLANLEQKPQK